MTNLKHKPMISISAHFKALGAPLKNIRWSWGAVRKGSDVVILRVWRDEIRKIKGNNYVQLTNIGRFKDSKHPGFRERLRHIDQLKSGSGGLLLFCQAKDTNAVPRVIAGFDEKLSRATYLIENQGDIWVGFADPE